MCGASATGTVSASLKHFVTAAALLRTRFEQLKEVYICWGVIHKRPFARRMVRPESNCGRGGSRSCCNTAFDCPSPTQVNPVATRIAIPSATFARCPNEADPRPTLWTADSDLSPGCAKWTATQSWEHCAPRCPAHSPCPAGPWRPTQTTSRPRAVGVCRRPTFWSRLRLGAPAFLAKPPGWGRCVDLRGGAGKNVHRSQL